MSRRHLAVVAQKSKALFGNYVDVIVERQRLSVGIEGKTQFYYNRECAANGETSEATQVQLPRRSMTLHDLWLPGGF